VLRNANQNFAVSNIDLGFTSIATAAGTTTLTVASTNTIYFTGTTTQTVVMPVTSTLVLGSSFLIRNNSTGNITVNSSGANLIATIIPGTSIHITCILTSGTTAASWDFGFTDYQANTGTGNVVLSVSPTITGTLTAATITASTSIATSGTATVSFVGTGIIAVGATTGTAAITVGQSTGAQTLNLATGATLTATTKAVNIGTNGVAGSTTNITIGSTTGTSTTTLNGTVALASIITAPLGSAAAPSYTFTGDTNTGMWSPAADTIAFSEGGVEAMRIDSSGNVGIGVTNPQQLLALGNTTDQVGAGVSGAVSTVYFGTPSNASGGIKRIAYDRATGSLNFIGNSVASPLPQMTIDTNGNVGIGTISPSAKLTISLAAPSVAGGQLLVKDPSYSGVALVQGASGEGYLWNISNNFLSFATNNTERARIDSSGFLLVGTTAPLGGNTSNEYKNTTAGSWPLTLNANDRGLLIRQSAASSGIYAYFEYNGGTNNGQISWSGGTTSYTTTSDARVKKNIVDAPDAGALIDAIKVRSWDFKVDDMHWRYGMVAQELLPIAPEAVTVPEDEEKMMGIDYSKLVPMLIKEVQSLRARVAQLEGN
jgi:hypothetical protein